MIKNESSQQELAILPDEVQALLLSIFAPIILKLRKSAT